MTSSTVTPPTKQEIQNEKRKNAVTASRTMLLMQWPAYTVLGLMGLIMPLFGNVDEIAFLGTLLLITGMVQVLILFKYGINPGFSWRLGVTLITFIASLIILIDPMKWGLNITITMGIYMIATGIYVVIEGRYSFKRSHIETVVYCGFAGTVMGFSLLKGWPQHEYWNATTAISVYLLLLGQTARVFIFNRSAQDKRYKDVLGSFEDDK
jgi:uncharacterized membrane protein HdeD (DUF308 family)